MNYELQNGRYLVKLILCNSIEDEYVYFKLANFRYLRGTLPLSYSGSDKYYLTYFGINIPLIFLSSSDDLMTFELPSSSNELWVSRINSAEETTLPTTTTSVPNNEWISRVRSTSPIHTVSSGSSTSISMPIIPESQTDRETPYGRVLAPRIDPNLIASDDDDDDEETTDSPYYSTSRITSSSSIETRSKKRNREDFFDEGEVFMECMCCRSWVKMDEMSWCRNNKCKWDACKECIRMYRGRGFHKCPACTREE